MDLTTTYLGMTLRTPLVPSASPLSEDLDTIKRLEDAGAAAVVLYSLFEEQITEERAAFHHHLTYGTESYAEALSYFPEPTTFPTGPEGYLEHIRRAKAAVDIPIIASLNGASVGGWTSYAQLLEQAGADALELNIYAIPTDVALAGSEIEATCADILAAVKGTVSIPVALKISPFFSNLAHLARRLDSLGADGLVLFNRFYQPDIDLENLHVYPHILLSTPYDLRLPLRWIAILYGHVQAHLAATGGVHTAEDVIKMLMVGASVTMMCSALLLHGPEHLRSVEAGMRQWMEEHDYVSVRQMQGSMSQRHCANPSAFERAHYMRALHSWEA